MHSIPQRCVGGIDQRCRPVSACAHEFQNSVIRSVAAAMPSVKHGEAIWGRRLAGRRLAIEHDRPCATMGVRERREFRDEPPRGLGAVAPPTVRTRPHNVVAVHEHCRLHGRFHGTLSSSSCRGSSSEAESCPRARQDAIILGARISARVLVGITVASEAGRCMAPGTWSLACKHGVPSVDLQALKAAREQVAHQPRAVARSTDVGAILRLTVIRWSPRGRVPMSTASLRRRSHVWQNGAFSTTPAGNRRSRRRAHREGHAAGRALPGLASERHRTRRPPRTGRRSRRRPVASDASDVRRSRRRRRMVSDVRLRAFVVADMPTPRRSPDPKDDAISVAAVAGEANFVVSGDGGDAAVFRETEGIPVRTAREALQIVPGSSAARSSRNSPRCRDLWRALGAGAWHCCRRGESAMAERWTPAGRRQRPIRQQPVDTDLSERAESIFTSIVARVTMPPCERH